MSSKTKLVTLLFMTVALFWQAQKEQPNIVVIKHHNTKYKLGL
jgi:hypothetical protein